MFVPRRLQRNAYWTEDAPGGLRERRRAHMGPLRRQHRRVHAVRRSSGGDRARDALLQLLVDVPPCRLSGVFTGDLSMRS